MTENETTQSERFMLEEYRNIATTHDKLRDSIYRLFNYFLAISAVPFTVAGLVFRQVGGFDLLRAPFSLYLLFLFFGISDLLLGLSFFEARLRQYSYAHTVNLIRKYFADRNKELIPYLLLSTSPEVPSFSRFGSIGFQLMIIALAGCAYISLGFFGLFINKIGSIWGCIFFVCVFIASCLTFGLRCNAVKIRHQKEEKAKLEEINKAFEKSQ